MRAYVCGNSRRNESREPTIGKAFLGICPVIYFALIGIVVAVGQMLGTSPPNPIPTATRWAGKFGFSITYVLAFQ